MQGDASGILKMLIGVLVVVVLLPSFIGIGTPTGSASFDPVVGQNNTLDNTVDDIPGKINVRATKENALLFDGSSSVSTNAAQNMTDGSWSVCSSAQLADTASPNETYTVFAHDNASVLILYDAGQWTASYDNGTADARATIDAPSPKDGYTAVCARYDASTEELVVARDGTVSAPDTMDTITNVRNATWDWNGKLDEIRVWDEAVSNSTITAYSDDPVQPLNSTSQIARFMFDEGKGSSTTVHYSASDATVHGAQWSEGVEGPNLKRGTDYEVYGDPLTVKVVSGSYLEGAPVAFATWGSLLPFDVIGIMAMLFALLLLATMSREIQDMLP